MLEFLKHAITWQNQFAAGGLLLMIIGGISVFLRALPERIWSFIVSQTTMMVSVKDDDIAFVWVKEWFLEQEFLKQVRRVDLDTTLRGADLALIPAPGFHWFWYARRPFWVWFYRSEDTKNRSQRRIESLTFRTLGRDRKFVESFVAEVVQSHKEKINMASLLYVYHEGWTNVQAYAPRLLESVILPPGQKEHLIEDVGRFRRSRHRYARLGVPYHRGYLLYGSPGTGKTSLVSAIGARFGMSIYAVNLTELNDRTLKTAINEVPENSIILFEDIDCMKFGNRPGSEETAIAASIIYEKNAAEHFGVTLSGLLNVLDGLHAPDNVLFVLTTNRIEALDPALLRPGRIDYKLYLGKASESQKIELYRGFFPGTSETEAKAFTRAHPVDTMAEFQGLLLGLEQRDLETMELVPASRKRAILA